MLQVSKPARYPISYYRLNNQKSVIMSSTTTINEFKDILNAEVYIDLDKLRGLSRHGVPKEVRGVSKYFNYLFICFL